MNAREILHNGHRTLLQAIEGLPEADWYVAGAVGIWSVKDIISHLASYELVLIETLKSLLEGTPTPTADRLAQNPLAFNDPEINRRRGLSATRVWQEYEKLYEESLRLIDRLNQEKPAEIYHTPGALPWYGAENDLEDFITYTFYGHKREHSSQIAAYRERLSRQNEQRAARAREIWENTLKTSHHV